MHCNLKKIIIKHLCAFMHTHIQNVFDGDDVQTEEGVPGISTEVHNCLLQSMSMFCELTCFFAKPNGLDGYPFGQFD